MRLLLSFLTSAVIALGVASCEDSGADEATDDDKDPSSTEDDDTTEDDDDDDEGAKKDSGRGNASADAGTKRDGGGSLLDAATGDGGRTGAGDAKAADGSQVTNDSGASGGTGSDYSPCPTNGDPCKVLPLGDSITVGLGYSGGYRVELFNKAVADGKNITFVGTQQNGPSTVAGKPFPKRYEAYSGWTISQIAGLVPDPALDEEPDIILLMAGTNDVAWAGPQGAPMRLDMLISAITSGDPHALLVVAQLTPLGNASGEAQAKTYNEALPAIVESHANKGEHVILVDMHTGFPTSELGDGVHPNQKGYERMAAVWYEAIAPVLR